MNYFISNYIPKNKTINRLGEKSYSELTQDASKYLINSKYYKPHLKYNEDLISNLCVTICRADETHDSKLGNSLETHRINYVNWEIFRFLKQLSKQRERGIVPLSERIKAPTSSDTKTRNRMMAADVIDSYRELGVLSLVQYDVLSRRAIWHQTNREISLHYGTSKQYINEVYTRAIKKILKDIELKKRIREVGSRR